MNQSDQFDIVDELDTFLRDDNRERVEKLRDDIEKRAREETNMADLRQATKRAAKKCRIRNEVRGCYTCQNYAGQPTETPTDCPIFKKNANGLDPTEDDISEANAFAKNQLAKRQVAADSSR